MEPKDPIVAWAVELQSLAQAGLTYGRDTFDRRRYQRMREIAAEMMAAKSGLSLARVKGLFCNEKGYQTPKLDTRAAIFCDGKILLVRERDGKWSLPGGWVDVRLSVGENAVKEVREEAGLDVAAERIIAVQDRDRHNLPAFAYGVCIVFVLCRVRGGRFAPNEETTESACFDLEELPELSTAKNTAEQIAMCFDAFRAGDAWRTRFD